MKLRALPLAVLAVVLALAGRADAVRIFNPSATSCSGDINAACNQVTSGTHIGSGTLSNNAISGWPLTFYQNNLFAGSSYKPTAANNVYAQGIELKAYYTFSNISVTVATADGANPTDFGIYTAAGTLVAHVGAATYGSTGNKNLALTGGSGAPYTLAPGNYVFAFTSSANILACTAGTSSYVWVLNGNAGASAAGVLPNTITAPTLAPSNIGGCEIALF